MLEFLASELGRSRILIIGAFRDVDPTLQEPLTTTLAALGRQAGTKRLGLAGITESDVAELIRLTEGVEASGALVEAVHDETEGNPLFVGEVVRLLAQEGLLEGGREEVKRMGVPGRSPRGNRAPTQPPLREVPAGVDVRCDPRT